MSNDNVGRGPRSNGGNAPVGSTVAIVVTALAVVLGFLILRKVNDGGDSSVASTVAPSSSIDTSSSLLITTTTQPPLVTQGTKVQVANASGVTGVAKQMTIALSGKGFDMAEATNSTVDPKLTISKVIYDPNDPNAQPVANSVALVLGGIVAEPATGAPPTAAGAFATGSSVVVLLGTDLAGKTLPAINGQPTTGTTTPATVPVATAPVATVPLGTVPVTTGG
jgi:hypothetical protein